MGKAIRPYIALLSRDPKVAAVFKEAELREAARLLGVEARTIFAVPYACGFAFVSVEQAAETLRKLQLALGTKTRLAVLELGRDRDQYNTTDLRAWAKEVLG